MRLKKITEQSDIIRKEEIPDELFVICRFIVSSGST